MYNLYFRVTAMKRSGSHAIVNWISSLYSPNRIKFINDVQLNHPITIREFESRRVSNKLPYLKDFTKSTMNDIIIFNHEEKKLDKISSSIRSYDNRFYDVIIMRDSMNCFAGMFGWQDKMKEDRYNVYDPKVLKCKVARWKSYALEFMGFTNKLPFQKIPINYNLWCVSEEYRRFLISFFPQSTYNEDAVCQVSGYGWGSSFNNIKELENILRDDKNNSNIFANRYKECSHIREYMQLFKDEELIDLSKFIFGIEY